MQDSRVVGAFDRRLKPQKGPNLPKTGPRFSQLLVPFLSLLTPLLAFRSPFPVLQKREQKIEKKKNFCGKIRKRKKSKEKFQTEQKHTPPSSTPPRLPRSNSPTLFSASYPPPFGAHCPRHEHSGPIGAQRRMRRGRLMESTN